MFIFLLLGGYQQVTLGRISIVVVAITGTLPLLFDPDELDATTVTGTMVPGLGPPIYVAALACVFKPAWSGRSTLKKRPVLFLLPFLYGASLGTVYQMQSQVVGCVVELKFKMPYKYIKLIMVVTKEEYTKIVKMAGKLCFQQH